MTTSALHVARTGLDAQDVKMRVIANNLANVNTLGFKRDRANFEALSYQNVIAAGSQADSQNKLAIGMNLGTGVQLTGTERMDTQGTMQSTGNSLDLAIEGSGYFQVQTADGSTAYTRAGNFKLSAEGTVVNPDGLPLIPQITVPEGATAVSVGADGSVSAKLPGQTESTILGQIETASFVNANGLQAVGSNLLLETAASGTAKVGAAGAEGRGSIRSGMLEQSNVNTVEELVDMIETQRAYEIASKMIKATDEMLQYTNQQL
jgi:flagellar basal-body rod protein FlgG